MQDCAVIAAAQPSLADTIRTPNSSAVVGLGTPLQAVPFQRMIAPLPPTASAVVG
jgi:hypothetical protein